ncbi:hypothetical protein T484DRAFT_1887394, partial [Baffinella frigidus]
MCDGHTDAEHHPQHHRVAAVKCSSEISVEGSSVEVLLDLAQDGERSEEWEWRQGGGERGTSGGATDALEGDEIRRGGPARRQRDPSEAETDVDVTVALPGVAGVEGGTAFKEGGAACGLAGIAIIVVRTSEGGGPLSLELEKGEAPGAEEAGSPSRASDASIKTASDASRSPSRGARPAASDAARASSSPRPLRRTSLADGRAASSGGPAPGPPTHPCARAPASRTPSTPLWNVSPGHGGGGSGGGGGGDVVARVHPKYTRPGRRPSSSSTSSLSPVALSREASREEPNAPTQEENAPHPPRSSEENAPHPARSSSSVVARGTAPPSASGGGAGGAEGVARSHPKYLRRPSSSTSSLSPIARSREGSSIGLSREGSPLALSRESSQEDAPHPARCRFERLPQFSAHESVEGSPRMLDMLGELATIPPAAWTNARTLGVGDELDHLKMVWDKTLSTASATDGPASETVGPDGPASGRAIFRGGGGGGDAAQGGRSVGAARTISSGASHGLRRGVSFEDYGGGPARVSSRGGSEIRASNLSPTRASLKSRFEGLMGSTPDWDRGGHTGALQQFSRGAQGPSEQSVPGDQPFRHFNTDVFGSRLPAMHPQRTRTSFASRAIGGGGRRVSEADGAEHSS